LPRAQATRKNCRLEQLPVFICNILAVANGLLPTSAEGEFKMNSDTFEGQWKQLKGTVKQKWGKLTDDDLTTLSGKKDELVGKLQERYGYTREQALKEADDWAAAAHQQTDPAVAHSGRY
jgi:uncharacterized protein YjbJ (UPF0337 family)